MKMIIRVGTLRFEDGTFQKDDIVEVTPERFAMFEPNDVQAIPEEAVERVIEAVALKRAKQAKPAEAPLKEDAPVETAQPTPS